jgi:hypothetical protein
MKTNIIIAIAGIIVFLLFVILTPEVLVSILFGFSAIGIGCTIKLLVLNIHKKIKQKDRTGVPDTAAQ